MGFGREYGQRGQDIRIRLSAFAAATSVHESSTGAAKNKEISATKNTACDHQDKRQTRDKAFAGKMPHSC